MRIIKSDCQVEYSGRGKTTSSRGERVIIIKDDMSVLIHRDKGISPMNYMSPRPKVDVREEVDRRGYNHIIASSKNETIDITMFSIGMDFTVELEDDLSKELERSGTEKQLQEWISRHFGELFGIGSRFVMREFHTTKGDVDLLGVDADDAALVIEVKRKAKKSDVFQVVRYREAISNMLANGEIDRMMSHGEIGEDEMDFSSPRCFLAFESGSKEVLAECSEHDIIPVVIDKSWEQDEIDNIIARRVRT